MSQILLVTPQQSVFLATYLGLITLMIGIAFWKMRKLKAMVMRNRSRIALLEALDSEEGADHPGGEA